MSMPPLNEDTLVQTTTADYLQHQPGWETVFACNDESFGEDGTLGRLNDKEVVLTRYLGEALVKFDPGLPDAAFLAERWRIKENTAFWRFQDRIGRQG